jgi:hypothetical protein
MRRRSANAGKRAVYYPALSYAELLATFPWITLQPNWELAQCEAMVSGRSRNLVRPCKVNAILRYVDLDGSVHRFCAQHLHQERFDDHVAYDHGPIERERLYAEVVRCRKWARRANFTIAMDPVEATESMVSESTDA